MTEETKLSTQDVTAMMRDVFSTTVQFIVAAEAAMPEGKRGKEKLGHVKAQALAYAPLVGLSLALVDALAPMLEVFASRVVSLFNRTSWPKLGTQEPGGPTQDPQS